MITDTKYDPIQWQVYVFPTFNVLKRKTISAPFIYDLTVLVLPKHQYDLHCMYKTIQIPSITDS